MGDLGPIKLIVGAGVVMTAFLIGVGMFTNSENEKHTELVHEARQERTQMMNMAMEQARQAQQMARQHQRHMEAMIHEAEYGNYPAEHLTAEPTGWDGR